MTILYNDGLGNFNDRQDIWVAGNQSRNADWDEFANVELLKSANSPATVQLTLSSIRKTTPSRATTKANPLANPAT
jgi:hypothetical protein